MQYLDFSRKQQDGTWNLSYFILPDIAQFIILKKFPRA